MTYPLYAALPIDAATIAMVFDIAFFSIIGLIILGFLVGLIRGFWKSGFRLIIVGGLVIASFIMTRPLSDYISTIDFGALLPTFGVNLPAISINLAGTPVTVTITTIQETILSFVTQMFTGLGLGSGDSQATADLIFAFTLVLIRYISFIVIGLIIVTLGEFLATLLYFFPFRLFIPKSWRKRHKVRLLGGFANAVKVALVTVMMMIPFSSLLNTINQAFHNPDNGVVEGVTDETYNSIMGFLDAYDQSMFAQFLFNWYVDENGKTLDTTLMDYITGENVGDYTLTLSNEINTIASIGQTILSTGALTSGLTDTTLQLAMTEDIIASLFINLTGSSLIMKILPIAMAVAMNAEAVQTYVDPTLLNLETVNWEDELNNIKDISVEVIRSGILDQILDPAAPELTATSVLPLLIDDEAYPHVRLALQSIDNSDFLSQVMPAVLFTLTQDEITAGLPAGSIGLSTFLPTEWEDYADIHLGEELALVYDAFHSLMGLDPDLLSAIMALVMPSTPEGSGSYHVAEDGYTSPFMDPELGYLKYPNRQTAYDDLITIIRENSEALIKLIVGDLDANGVPTNVDLETGKTLLLDEFGAPIAGAVSCLFDSGILVYGLDRVLSSVLTPALAGLAGGAAFDTATLDAAIVELNGINNGEKRFNFKGEFGAVLGILTAIIGNDVLLSLIIPQSSNSSSETNPVVPSVPSLKQIKGEPLRSSASDASSSSQTSTNIIDMFSDADFRNGLKEDVFPLLDRSRIMGAVIPSVMETALSGDTMNSFLEILGITVDDLNFEFSDVGTQMGYLVDLIGYSFSVMDVGVENIFDNIEAISGDMIGLLDSIYFSDIFNPKDEDGNLLSENYYSLLGTVFEQAAALGLDPAEVDTAARTITFDPGTGYDGWTTTYDVDGNLVNAGENYNLVNFVVIALSSDLLSLDPANGDLITQMITFAQDPADPIGEIFSSVDSSVIISATFGGVLDGFFGTTGGLIDEDLGTSFRNVTDWASEGDNLKTIIVSLEGFSEGLSGIDFMNSDPLLLGDILKGLARSQIFNKSTDDSYLFPDFLLGNLKGAGSIVGTYLYDPYEDDVTNNGDPFDEITSDFHAIGSTVLEAHNWYEDNGEIDTILGFITAIKDVTGEAANPITFLQSDTSITSTDIESIMLALNDASSLRVLLYNLFESLLGTDQFALGTLTPSDSNTYIFMTLSEAERAVEIGYLSTLFGAIKDLDLSGVGGFNMESLSPANLDQVEIMLNTMHDSQLFNTFDNSSYDRGLEPDERNHTNGDMTVFEQTINMMLDVSTLDSYIYRDLAPGDIPGALQTDIISIPNDLGGTVVLTDGWVGNDGEIRKIFNIISNFKDTGISFADFGGDGATAISGLMSTPEGTTSVENLLLSINDSTLVNPAIGHLFDEIFTSGAFALSGVDLTEANTRFFLDEEDKDLRAQEISVLIDIYSDIDGLSLNNGGALTLDSIDSARINLMLNNLHDSQVFNTFTAGHDHASSNLTIFEQTIAMVIDTATLDTYIYPGLTEGEQSTSLTADIILIDNNLAGTVVVTDKWIGVDGEISNITNILESFKATGIDFTSFGTDGGNSFSTLMNTAEGVNKAENLLLDINHSLLIYPAIPGLVDQIFTTGAYQLDGINLSDANTNYFREESDVAPRDTEITLLIDIYSQMDTLGLNYGGTLTIDGIDSNNISTMLIDIHGSAVLNSLVSGKSHLTNDLTVFEQTIKMIYTVTNFTAQIYPTALEGDRPGLLTADIIDINNEFAPLDPLTEDEWEATIGGEISNIKGILEAVKAIDIPFGDFSSDAGVQAQLNTLISDPVGKEKIRDLMQAINLSLIAWPADPNLLENMFSTASFSVTGVTLADANPNYLHSMPISSERATEIDSVINTYDLIEQLGINAGSFDVSMIDSVVIRDLLETFHESVIFNTIRADRDRLLSDLTVFEQTIRMIIDSSELDSYIYQGMGDIAKAAALAEDIIARDNNFAGTAPLADDGWMDNGGEREISKILNILDAFLATSLDFTDFGGGTSNQLLSDLMDTPAGITSVENLLLAVNHSVISYPAVPNLFDTMLTAGDASITGVDFSTAYTHYRGNRGDQLIDDIYLPYDDTEIGQILTIFNDVKNISGQVFSNLSTVTISVIDDMQALVESLFESNVFHIAGAASLVASDPTVFEQIIIKMMIDTSIGSLLFHDTVVTSPNPNPNYYQAAVYRFATAAEKTEFLVVNYETVGLYNVGDYFTSSWDGANGEIVSFFRIFREMKRVLPTLVDASSVDPATMSPTSVGAIMSVLNYSNLASDAVPNLVRDAFASISFGVYTEDNEEYYLTPKTYDLVDLDTMDYTDTDFTDINPPELVGSIGLINELMSGFYEGDGLGYYDMGASFDIVDFIVTNDKSSVPIFHLLKDSYVFAPTVVGKTYQTRSLTLFNLLDPANITKWIDYTTVGTNKDSKSEKLEEIFTTLDPEGFEYVNEGLRMDSYIEVVTQFTNPAYDASNINGFGDQFKSIIELTYQLPLADANNGERAYLASEISAGFYTDMFEDEYVKVTPNPDVIDFYSNDYENLNPIEADGIHGSLALIDIFTAINGDPGLAPDYLDDLNLYFTEMGSKAHTLVTGGAYPTAYNYTSWTAAGNSLIACIFYAAEVIPNASFVQFNILMGNAAWNNHTAVVSLDMDPYATNFVFEIESDKITYSFTA